MPTTPVSPGVVVGLVAVLALAWLAYRPLLALGHLGWDTWPLLWASRITSVSDLAGSFSERLMDGLYPHGDFYRPVLNLSIALDHALWGTRAFGYHLTDLLLLLLSAGAVFGVGRRLLGDAWAALAACALFALHPLHFESLPVTARRGDALAGLFTLLALWNLPTRGGGRGLLAGGFALLAVGSKETGALAAPLLAALAFAEADGSLRDRALRGLQQAAPALAALALFVLLRSSVLGGLGGHTETSALAGVIRAPGLLLLFVPALLVPQPQGGLQPLLAFCLAILGAGFAVGVARSGVARGLAPLVWLTGSWAAGLLLLSGVSGDLAPWYASSFLPVYALLAAGLVAVARRGWRAGDRGRAVPAAVLTLALGLAAVLHSGLFERYPQWERLSVESQVFLDGLRERIETAPAAGATLRVRDLPERAAGEGRVWVHGAAGLGVYSVQAWAELEVPGRRVRVEPAAPGEIDVFVDPVRP